VVSADARSWIERHGFPLYRSPIGSMRLFYYPDRTAFVRDRLRPEDVAADRPRFEQDRDLIGADDDKFFLWGWEHPQQDAQGRYRSIVTPAASLYVPVIRQAPTALSLEVSDAPDAAVTVPVTIAVNDVPVGQGTLARARDCDCRTLRLDLAAAAWRYGANIVQLQVPSLDRGGQLAVRHLIFE
jgi:hypothetical protein